MSVMGLFFVLIASVAVWWLARQGVLRSPWLEEGEIADFPGAELLPRPPAAKVGLGVFLAVAGCLFSLLMRGLLHAHGRAGLAGAADSRDFMVQHGGLDREQRRAGSGATRRRSA